MINTNNNPDINENLDINEDLNIYKYIIKEYNLDLTNVNLIHEIYLLKIKINKLKSKIKKNNFKISKFKINFIEYISEWKLEDSCNKNKIKNEVLNIKKTHEIITYLKYLNEDLTNIINSYETKINTLLKKKKISINKKKCNKKIVENNDHFNFIINY